MSDRLEFGSIGRMKGVTGDFTFMVLCEALNPNLRMPRNQVAEVIILSGNVPYDGAIRGFGDTGPVAVGREEIEWLG